MQGFEIGEVLRGAFAVYAGNWLAFALLALITFAPLCVFYVVDPRILGDPAFPLPPEDAKDVAARRAYLSRCSGLDGRLARWVLAREQVCQHQPCWSNAIGGVRQIFRRGDGNAGMRAGRPRSWTTQ